ncbi:MAG TPA: PSD1 and planctomycete cytochrome C domain-containing protein [Bryobacteraceae bacterium]|nr:PSD1 and planctomycete cytochrome C domain-containing protein [Bryobacteraceae bacterium]
MRQRSRRYLAPLILACASCSALLAQSPPKGAADFFETHVRPVLAKNCFACHTAAHMGGLQLDSREHLIKGGRDGAVVVPGDPDKSVLIQAIRQTHPRYKMPPQSKLADQEIADLTTWVKMGAVWPETPGILPSNSGKYFITAQQRKFWAFQPVQKPAVPEVHDKAWPKTPIDNFILAKLEQKGLQPVRPADKRALIRRATFDLLGLPPAPAEVEAFVNDGSPDAFAKVVDRLLASPHYGERWGRYWLDLARYADGELGASKDTPFPNAYRYRDWVIEAFNKDMPYDLFVKAQIAGDLLKSAHPADLVPALGFYALGPRDDDRVDVTGQVFLGLTTGCARCHDHKYDPIPTQDFYSLLGVFKSTEAQEYTLVDENTVASYKRMKKEIDDQKNAVADFVEKHSTELSEILAAKTSRYLMAAWDVMNAVKPDCATAARDENLDETTLERWIGYLKNPSRDHKFLKPWDDLVANHAGREKAQTFADGFQDFVLTMFAEKHAMDDRNYVKLGGAAGVRDEHVRQYTNLESLPIEKYYLWRDLASEPYKKDFVDFKGGVYYYGAKDIPRFLAPEWREHLAAMQARLSRLKQDLPPQYPFLHIIRDCAKPADIRVHIRGDEKNLGEVAPRRFLAILSNGEPPPFKNGSGRLELAEDIATPANPLFARVMVNRIWQGHFGQGIVRTPSNFGLLGERPTHPELLDYLAAEFVERHWSIKAMHREIMLSAAYQLSTQQDDKDFTEDPANRLLWRANLRQRLDVEALRDALLAVSGKLDLAVGGPPQPLTDTNCRRTVYALISRTKLDSTLALFDFPNPNMTSEQRMATVGPMQRLYFMNNSFVALQAKALADRLNAAENDDAVKIARAYQLLFARSPSSPEIQLGLEFLAKTGQAWPQYVQVLLSSAEFSSVN